MALPWSTSKVTGAVLVAVITKAPPLRAIGWLPKGPRGRPAQRRLLAHGHQVAAGDLEAGPAA